MKRFFHKQRNVGFLFLTVVFLSVFSWFVVTFPPEALFHHLVFYVLLLGLSLTLCLYVFAEIGQSLIISGGVIIYFLLRSFNLRHPLYLFLLFICCVSILRLFSHGSSSPPKNDR